MREMEFLPAWYLPLRRKRRMTAISALITVSIAVCVGGWLLGLARGITLGQSQLRQLQHNIAQSQDQVRQLHDLQNVRMQMSQQAQAVRKLGIYVPTTRVIDTLDALMPQQMALLDLMMDTQSQAKAEPGLSTSRGPSQVDRRLRVRIHGVAAGDDEIGRFLTQLSTVPYFSGIAMTYSRDHADHGLTLREFEINFNINLNDDIAIGS